MLVGWVLLILCLGWLTISRSHTSQTGSRPSCFVESMMSGQPIKGQDGMYQCFLKDVRRERWRNRWVESSHSSSGFRFASFNIHFFRSGPGAKQLADTTQTILQDIRQINADAVAVQEVPVSLVPEFRQQLVAIGYEHTMAATAPKVHKVSGDGEQLMVMVVSRQPFLTSGAVTIGDGEAAYAAVRWSESEVVLMFSVHLSVRCPPEARLSQMQRLLAHMKSPRRLIGEHLLPQGSAFLLLTGGDMQQPYSRDYPADEWRAIAADLNATGLPSTDGVRQLMASSGFSDARTQLDNEGPGMPGPRMTAWNGVVVDNIYFKLLSGEKSLPPLELNSVNILYTESSDHLPIVATFTAHRSI